MVVSLSNPKATTEDRAGVRGPLLDLLVCLQLYNYAKRTHPEGECVRSQRRRPRRETIER